MSASIEPTPSGDLGPGGMLSRARVRGLTSLAIGVLAGLAVFALTAAWPSRSQATGTGPAGFAAWINRLPVESSHAVPAGERPSLVLSSENRGQVLFGRYCDSCHYAGNENIGPSLRSTQFKRTASAQKIAEYVRKGGYDMPAYSQAFLSDADLAAVVEYVRALPEASR